MHIISANSSWNNYKSSLYIRIHTHALYALQKYLLTLIFNKATDSS